MNGLSTPSWRMISYFDLFSVPQPLVDLHVKLLRKLGKSVTSDRWEKYLAKVSVFICVFNIEFWTSVHVEPHCMLINEGSGFERGQIQRSETTNVAV